MRAILAVFLLVVAACGDDLRGNITITTAAEFQPALDEFAALTPYPLRVQVAGERDDGFHIVIVSDPALPAQAYQLGTPDPTTVTVAASDVLGAQYGTAAALEALGFRFRHPYETVVPATPELAPGAIDDAIHRPEIRVRGFQLHTLHPIESYFAFWEPSAGNASDARRIIDWLIKNRGNYVQWVALDDILDPERHAPWKEHTAALIEYAHLRGVRVGLNLQLFGAANLQLAFDLVDEAEQPIGPQIAERLPLITDGLAFDVYDLSFGEFFNSEPQQFIDSVNEVHAQIQTAAPQAEMHAFIHVGADQRVTFMGEDLIYYFLVKFADPAIVPDVHSVMFYNLFEPTGGAYHHEDFSEHREFLLDRMCSGQPAAYVPETGYWVAFDNSVPQYFPLYVRNRWLDLAELADQPGCSALDAHVLFSTGWEWGFWLHDVTALRASYELPATPDELVAAEFAGDLEGATDPVMALIELQREHVMLGKLIAYLAGRDAAIDAGRQLGIVSQPDRVIFDDLVAGADPVAFEADVMQRLATYADALDAIAGDLDRVALADTRWSRELRDGFEIDRVRARFVLATYGATLAHVRGDAAEARRQLDLADSLFDAGHAIVARRHADLHDTLGRRLTAETTNRTFYQYGYLFMADTLCYWDRERVQVTGILDGVSTPAPSCLF